MSILLLNVVFAPTTISALGATAFVLYCLYTLYLAVSSPLRRVPGPFLARFSRLWLLKEAYYSTFPTTNIQLHRRHGPVVRIAPNEYSIDDPAAAKVIYASGKGYIKSPWYEASGNPASPVPGIFDERDPHLHAGIRRKVAAAYAMSSLVQSESFVDDCTDIFNTRLTEFAASGTPINLAHWLQCFAFDVIGKITFGDRFGFLDEGHDIQAVMSAINSFLHYCVRMGIFSEWHQPFTRLRRFMLSNKQSGLAYVSAFARERMDARFEKAASIEADFDPSAPADFVTKFIRIRAADPSKISKEEMATVCGANVGAGSDTTSISLSAVFYYLCKSPEALATLRQEIHEMAGKGLISDPVTFQEAQQMPSLQAVIKEALRMHPATGLILGRVVPEGGAQLAGQFFPEGTVVGINSWVAHRNEAVFGVDCEKFRPERWLEEPELVKKREAYFMTFGMGSRTCIGKNISLMEMSKVVPQLVRRFEFVPEHPDVPWTTENVWFVKPKEFRCRVGVYNRPATS